MGWLENTGEFLFGSETAKKAKANADAVAKTGADMAASAAINGKTYDKGAMNSMGANAGDYLNKATAAAQENASQQAAIAANQGMRSQLKAMRTGGMNAAASAARAGQAAGQNYAGNYGQGIQSGIGQYMQGTNQFANQGAEMAGRRATGAGIQMAAGQDQKATADATAQNTMGVGSMALGAVLSDMREKKEITPVDNSRISAILSKIDPVKYKYKNDDYGKGDQMGVTAQNLESAGLGGAVDETPDGTKMVNGAKVEAFNTDAIKMLNEKMDSILQKIGGAN
jgi:hypothetical protein